MCRRRELKVYQYGWIGRKAEFAERALAFAVDYALFAAAWVLILKFIDPGLPVLLNEKGTGVIAILAALFIVYQAVLSCDGRATLGKLLLGLRVADAEGEVAEEEADEAEEFSQNAGIKATLKVRLVDIQKALEKIEHNEYGKCEECGMEIEPEVLAAAPESRYCKMHKK